MYRFRAQVAAVLIVLTMMVAEPVPMNAAPPQGPDGHECALTTAHRNNAGGGQRGYGKPGSNDGLITEHVPLTFQPIGFTYSPMGGEQCDGFYVDVEGCGDG